ncbi:peptidoglycan-binding domain-containing protein [Pelagovum pacificum]|uniref:Peptidoglycan-binding protein n=1 Tax=Pelagovum pacificum TaxID=2588711 RepID=A0A5C5GDW6_9RHOB|nr:peptidoglycan-binding domain-containing protein [Pelagovum pacificum]QQA43959.1 peptidoglycan-binding protein [Pelagovum pacificum]TNY32913.1 peptidoglycan-binding protein [Pelagovum pacificum]
MTQNTYTVRIGAEGGETVELTFDSIRGSAKQMFDQIKSGSASADQIADTFTRGVRDQSRAFNELRASLDPAYSVQRRYERQVEQVNRAVRAGAVDQRRAAAVLALVEDQYQDATAAAARYGGQVRRFDFRMLTMQLSQVSDMALATGDPLRALAVQGSDIGMLFGGPVAMGLGMAAGAGMMLLPSLLDLGGEAETLEEKFDGLVGALDEYASYAQTALTPTSELEERFGRFAETVRASAELMAGLSLDSLRDEVGDTADGLTESLGELAELMSRLDEQRDSLAGQVASGVATQSQLQLVRDDIAGLEEDVASAANELGVLPSHVRMLTAEFATFSRADGPREIVASATAIQSILDQMRESGAQLSPELRNVASIMDEVVQKGALAALAAEDLGHESRSARDIFKDVSSWVGQVASGIDDASSSAGPFERIWQSVLKQTEDMAAAAAEVERYARGISATARIPGMADLTDQYGTQAGFMREQLELQQQIARIEARRAATDAASSVLDMGGLGMNPDELRALEATIGRIATATSDADLSRLFAEAQQQIIAANDGVEGMERAALNATLALGTAATTMREFAGAQNAAVGDARMLTAALDDADTSAQTVANRLAVLGHDSTAEGIRAFQREMGIAVDGIVGPDTLAAIDQALAQLDEMRAASSAAATSNTERAAASDAAATKEAETAAVAARAATSVKDATAGLEKAVSVEMVGAVEAIVVAESAAQGAGQQVGDATVAGLSDGLSGAVSAVSEGMELVPASVLAQAAPSRAAGVSVGENIGDGISAGMRSRLDNITTTARSMAQIATSTVRSELQIQSPSRVMAELGAYSAEGFAEGLEEGGEAAEDAMESLADRVREVAEREQDMIDAGRKMGSDLVSGIIDGMGRGDLGGGLEDLLGGFQGDFTGWLTQGLGANFGTMMQTAAPILGGVSAAMQLIDGFSSEETIGEGQRGRLGVSGSYVDDWERIRRETFWGLSSSTSTEYDRNARASAEATKSVAAMTAGVEDMAAVFGGAVGDVRAVSVEFDSRNGGSLADGLQALNEAEAIAALGTRSLTREYETHAGALERISSVAGTLRLTDGMFGLSGRTVGPVMANDASRAFDRFGGPDAYAAGAQTIFGGMSPSEQLKVLRQQVAAQARGTGYSLSDVDTAAEVSRRFQTANKNRNYGNAAFLASIADSAAQMDRLRETIAGTGSAAKEAAAAQREAARAERERMVSEQRGLEIQRLQVLGQEHKAFQLQLAETPAHLRRATIALRDAQDAAAYQAERTGLVDRLLTARGDQIELDKRWLDSLHDRNRALGETILKEERAAAATAEMARAMSEYADALDPEDFGSRLEYMIEYAARRSGERTGGGAVSYVGPVSASGSTSTVNADAPQTVALLREVKQLLESGLGSSAATTKRIESSLRQIRDNGVFVKNPPRARLRVTSS